MNDYNLSLLPYLEYNRLTILIETKSLEFSPNNIVRT